MELGNDLNKVKRIRQLKNSDTQLLYFGRDHKGQAFGFIFYASFLAKKDFRDKCKAFTELQLKIIAR
jgi:hypothetical protein